MGSATFREILPGAMSQENVETFRETLKAFDHGDREAWLSLHDPDHEVIPGGFWPETTPIQGREAAWDFYAAIAQTLQARAFLDDIELESAGPDKVLAHQHGPVRGQASGAQVDLDLWVVGSFRAGKVVRDEWFATRDEALEAAGFRSRRFGREVHAFTRSATIDPSQGRT